MIPIQFVVFFPAVIAAGIFNIVLGMVWYTPAVFGKPWMKALGINMNDITDSKVNARIGYVVASVSAFAASYGLAVVLYTFSVTNVFVAIGIALGVWAAFNLTTVSKNAIFEDRPMPLFLIDIGYDIVCFSGMAVILTLWRGV